jgi:hypothetical protein
MFCGFPFRTGGDFCCLLTFEFAPSKWLCLAVAFAMMTSPSHAGDPNHALADAPQSRWHRQQKQHESRPNQQLLSCPTLSHQPVSPVVFGVWVSGHRHHRETRLCVRADWLLVAEILRVAERVSGSSVSLSLLDVLSAYDSVLEWHEMDPTSDVVLYQILLRLNQQQHDGPDDNDWWQRLHKLSGIAFDKHQLPEHRREWKQVSPIDPSHVLCRV